VTAVIAEAGQSLELLSSNELGNGNSQVMWEKEKAAVDEKKCETGGRLRVLRALER
jgi:hypothetical protein